MFANVLCFNKFKIGKGKHVKIIEINWQVPQNTISLKWVLISRAKYHFGHIEKKISSRLKSRPNFLENLQERNCFMMAQKQFQNDLTNENRRLQR